MRKKKMAILAIVLTAALMVGIMPAKIALADTYGMTGSGTAADPYVVTTASQLENLYTLPRSNCFKLGNDIDLSSVSNPSCIGIQSNPYAGTFDGAGHTISGVHYTISGNYTEVGFFCYSDSTATIENLTIIGTVSGGESGKDLNNFGLFAPTFSGHMTNCTANITVASASAFTGFGGMVGVLAGSLDHCSVVINADDCLGQSVGVTSRIGGICGEANYASVTNCISTGSLKFVVWGPTLCGGLIGEADASTVVSCESDTTVIESNSTGGTGSVGGLIGYSYITNVTDCFATKDVSGDDNVGGLIGQFNGGPSNAASLKNCYALGNVTSTYVTCNSVGGFVGTVGEYATIQNNYCLGDVTCNLSNGKSNYAGGFVGTMGSNIFNSFSTGEVTGVGSAPSGGVYLGGFSGNGGATGSSYCYFNSTVNKPGMVGVGYGGNDYTTRLSTDQMKNSSFSSTLNSNITASGATDWTEWIQTASTNNGYPCLKGVGVGSDTTPPTGSYSLSKSAWTCKPVVITVTATDDQSGVASIMRPDNTVVSGTTATFTVTDNGTYNFILADNAGNTCTYPVTVANIDRNVSVTHEQTVTYTIDPNSSTLSGGTITLTNNDPHIGVAVYVSNLVSNGITDVEPNSVDWSNLNAAQTERNLAIGTQIIPAGGGWNLIAQAEPVYAKDITGPVLLGVINPDSTGSLSLIAKYGLAWSKEVSVSQTLSLTYAPSDVS